jgi:HSP20 family protein
VEVTFDLPGIDPDSIDVTVEGNLVTIAGERTVDRPEDGQVLVEGRPSGRFVGRVTLGDQVDLDQLQARYGRPGCHARPGVLRGRGRTARSASTSGLPG